MRSRSPCCLSATFATCLFLSAAQAQVIPFAGNFGQGLSPSDNQMVFESVARLNAAEPRRSASPIRRAIRRRKAPVPPLYCGYSTQAACLAIWCAITSSRVGYRLGTTSSPGAAHRPESGRSGADPIACTALLQWV
jgi:hypothetical protein